MIRFLSIVLITLSLSGCGFLSQQLDAKTICALAVSTCNVFDMIRVHTAENDSCTHYTPVQVAALRQFTREYQTAFKKD